MIRPTYSLGVRIIARTRGSETLTLLPGSGRSWGDLISLTLPSGRVTRWATDGAVATRSRSYSRSSRSHDLHVEQAEEANPEPESQGTTRLGLPHQRPVVQAELLQRLPQPLEVVAIGGKEAEKTIGFGSAYPGSGSRARARGVGQGVPDLDPIDLLDPGDQIAHLACLEH